MAKGKKAGKGKKEPPKKITKEPAKKEAPKPKESARSTRSSSRATPQETAAKKRKASPSPVPKKAATSAKKTRPASPSPAPAARGRAGRGASVPAPKAEAPTKESRSTSRKKEARVTRAVVEDAETKKAAHHKPRSISRAKAAPTPKKTQEATSEQKATPRGRSSTPRTPVTPKRKETPAPKATARGRSTTPRSKPATPQQKTTTPKAKPATPKSRSVTPKAASPKQKAATPKQKAATEKTTPKQKTPTPKKETPPKKATPTKTPPNKTTRISSRKSVTPSKTEDEATDIEKISPAVRISETKEETEEQKVETSVENEPEAEVSEEVVEEMKDIADPEKQDDKEVEQDEEEAMEVDEEHEEEVEKQPDEEADIENDVAHDETNEPVDQVSEKEDREEVAQEEQDVEEEEKETEEVVEEEPGAEEEETEEIQKAEEEEVEEEAEEEVIENEVKSEEAVEQEEEDVQMKEIEQVVQASESVSDIDKASAIAFEQIRQGVVGVTEKDEIEKASVIAQADETERMEELVAALGDGEKDIVSTEHSTGRQEPVVEIGSGDTGDSKSVEEVQCQAAVQHQTVYPVVEVPDGENEIEESEVNTTGIEIAQEVTEASADSGGFDMNETEVNDITPIQLDEGSSSLSNGEQPSTSPRKRKHDEVEDEEEFKSPKKARVSESLEYNQETYTNGDGSGESEDITKDYVVIEMGDVPPSESQEVIESVPKETVQNFSSEEAVANEPETVKQTATESVPESNPVYNRMFIPNPNFDGADASKHFSILSYNVLADCHLFRNDYSFTGADYLEPDYRLNKLVEEIQFLDADIVCLQEVDPDFFQDQLMPSMKSLGYGGFHKKRTEEFYDEGEATFYKTSRFTLVDVTTHRVADLVEKAFVEGMDPTIQAAVRQYMDRADVLVVAKLQCNNSGQEVTVGNIHVTWGEMKVPDVQALQIACAIKEVVNKAGSEAHPHIICGDFNSEPYSSGYLMAKDGYLNDEGTINKLQQLKNVQLPDERMFPFTSVEMTSDQAAGPGPKMESLVNCLWSGFQHTSSSLKSVYFTTQGAEPEITTYNRIMCACVDYIFYSSSSLDPVGVLQTAQKDRIMETGGTPNCYFPSDHVSLKAVLSFK